MSGGDLGDRWRSFYREHYQDDIQEIAGDYPDERSLYVDVLDLHGYDDDLAGALFSEPDRTLRRARDVLRDAHDGFERVNVRLSNHPGLIGIRSLRSRHIAELVTVEGRVEEVGPIQSRAAEAIYACRSCGTAIRRPQDGLRLTAPSRCPDCEELGPFALREDRCTFVDVQRVGLEDPPGDRPDDDPGRTIDVYLDDDLVDTVTPDNQLLVTGVVRLDRRGEDNLFDFYIDGVTAEEEPSRDRTEESAGDALQRAIESRWEGASGWPG